MFTTKAVVGFLYFKKVPQSPFVFQLLRMAGTAFWPPPVKEPAEFWVVSRPPFWACLYKRPVLCLRHTTFSMYLSQPVTKTRPKQPKTGPPIQWGLSTEITCWLDAMAATKKNSQGKKYFRIRGYVISQAQNYLFFLQTQKKNQAIPYWQQVGLMQLTFSVSTI